MLLPGTHLGPYEIVSHLGSGGMGDVYRARDPRLQRDVAIKVLPPAVAEDPDRLRRFQSEARAIAALNHPNICQVYDVGPNYLVLEYIEGVPLKGPLPIERAVPLASQIADALDAAHRRGILHRDLKPANIMVAGDTAKMLDFGLAKWLNDDTTLQQATRAGTIVGTLAYMSPEQANAQPCDARSDIFSLGAVLHELLSGQRAFDGTTNIDIVTAVLRRDPPAASSSPDVSAIVKRCLEKTPSDRFQSAADLKAALERLRHRATDAGQPSIAVLPFADMSAGKDHEWFGDGLAEEILNALTHLQGLKVIARTSAFAFKGKQDDIRKIATALDVTTVLEGSVRRAGNRVRVTAQLIKAGDGTHLWSERYDRDMTDVFEIQDDIARAIASALELKLLAGAARPRSHTPELVAYDAYVKARHLYHEYTHASLVRGYELYRQAITLDPDFALAHCGLALCCWGMCGENFMKGREAIEAMTSEGQRALALDPSLPEAHTVMAMAAASDYDWRAAERHFQIALSSGPVSPDVRYWYSLTYLCPLGKGAETLRQMDQALIDDPLSVLFRAARGMLYLGAGNEERGAAELRQALELDGHFFIAHLWLCALAVKHGRFDEALARAEQAYAVAPSTAIGWLAATLSLKGETARANALRETFGAGEAQGAPAGLVCYYGLLGDFDEAAVWYERAIAQRDPRAPWILAHLFDNSFTSSRHWPRLAALMNLPVVA
jgi:eukaryotic-like serine/threonine-protein kinase